MHKWWKYGYWAWPWKDSHLTGPFYSYLGLGPWTIWYGYNKRRLWVEWNIDEYGE